MLSDTVSKNLDKKKKSSVRFVPLTTEWFLDRASSLFIVVSISFMTSAGMIVLDSRWCWRFLFNNSRSHAGWWYWSAQSRRMPPYPSTKSICYASILSESFPFALVGGSAWPHLKSEDRVVWAYRLNHSPDQESEMMQMVLLIGCPIEVDCMYMVTYGARPRQQSQNV